MNNPTFTWTSIPTNAAIASVLFALVFTSCSDSADDAEVRAMADTYVGIQMARHQFSGDSARMKNTIDSALMTSPYESVQDFRERIDQMVRTDADGLRRMFDTARAIFDSIASVTSPAAEDTSSISGLKDGEEK